MAKYRVEAEIGNTYNDLTITSEAGMGKHGIMVNVICICGNKRICRMRAVLSGAIKSCGCLTIKRTVERLTTHGLSNHPLFTTWGKMKQRCYDITHKQFKNYGARGVRICKEWLNNFKSFYDWCIENGWQKGLQIDKDIIPERLGIPALLYSPEMCLIVTNKINQNTKRNSVKYFIDGVYLTMPQIAEKYSLKATSLVHRVKVFKWDIKKAVETPFKKTGRPPKKIVSLQKTSFL